MIQTFIEKNKKLLQTYSIVARIIGWVLVIMSAMPTLLIPYLISGTFHEHPGGVIRIWGALLEVLFAQLPLGIIVLGVAQFIRYASEKNYRPGWLLRHGSSLLYLFAALIIIGAVTKYCYIYPRIEFVSSIYIKMKLLPNVAVMLILIGFGNILRRLLPMIEEHKSLV